MIQYILRKTGYGFLVMAGVITVIFLLFSVLPGDSAIMTMGQRSDVSSEEAVRKELGLDLPLATRYINYINDMLPVSLHNGNNTESTFYLDTNKYDFISLCKLGQETVLVAKKPYLGRSYQNKRLVMEMLNEAVPKTALLAVVSIFFAIVAGIVFGILCAVFKDTWFDKSTLVVSVMGMALPSFFAAILFAWVFAFLLADQTGLNMFGSLYTVSDFGEGEYLDLKNLILPAITLGIRPLATVTELMRNSTLEVMSQDYIRTAKAKGLHSVRIIQKHIVKNALNPVVTAISGWLAGMMAGAVFVEYVFDYKGVGVMIVNGLEKYDFPVVMGSLLYISVILVLINIAVDIIYGFLDPRAKIKG
ncbi:MAG: ABC transporter permease [Bacteroidales bacterium]|jgi:peptide/nickel transport system permease protein|nr:ABC transporter permease [Bacteroidales bacterium]